MKNLSNSDAIANWNETTDEEVIEKEVIDPVKLAKEVESLDKNIDSTINKLLKQVELRYSKKPSKETYDKKNAYDR